MLWKGGPVRLRNQGRKEFPVRILRSLQRGIPRLSLGRNRREEERKNPARNWCCVLNRGRKGL